MVNTRLGLEQGHYVHGSCWRVTREVIYQVVGANGSQCCCVGQRYRDGAS